SWKPLMKSNTMAITTTAISRLTMFDGEIGKQVRHVVAVVDGVFEVVERLALAEQAPDVRVLFAEQRADRRAVDRVGILLDLTHPAGALEQRRVAVHAQVRHRVADHRGHDDELAEQL